LLQGEEKKNDSGGMYINARPTYGVSTCDIDQNGFVDILTTSTSRYYNNLWMNVFTLDEGNRTFQDEGLKSFYGSDYEGRLDPRGGGRTFFSSCTDYNNDGAMDLYLGELTHSYDNSSVDKSSVLTGTSKKNPPEFIRTEYMNDISTINWNQGDRRAVWFDYNLDGLIDLLVDNSGFPPTSRLVLFEQKQNHAFENIGANAGIDIINPTGSVVLDINRDGRLDILTAQSSIRNTNIGKRVYLFENQSLLQGNRSLRFFPRGVKANTSALGSTIILKTIKRGQDSFKRQWVEYSQGGLPSQNEEGVIFGLERGEVPVEVVVRWPIARSKKERGRKSLVKRYDIKGYQFKYNLNITLCESGRHYPEIRLCD
jgi:hypothetical protein